MTDPPFNSWQSVQEEVLARIHSRQWKPGDLIPNEADLAQEFGCARATVNRALQNLADEGLLDRRRKAVASQLNQEAAEEKSAAARGLARQLFDPETVNTPFLSRDPPSSPILSHLP